MESFIILPERESFDLRIKLTPKARHNRIGPMAEDSENNPVLKISVTAAPENGKANAAMIKSLAKALGLAKGDIEVVAGQTSRNKKIRLRGNEAALISRLRKLTEKETR